jgi:hypothetical protein
MGVSNACVSCLSCKCIGVVWFVVEAGTDDDEELRQRSSESNAVELARLLYWLMVGYGMSSCKEMHILAVVASLLERVCLELIAW